MSVVTTEPAVQTSAEERFTAIYEKHFPLLAAIAVHKFRVPDTEAETLAHEVFLTYLRKSDTILDLRGWLIGAICHASRHYWRLNGRTLTMEEDFDFDRPDPASSFCAYFGFTPKYAQKLVSKCLKRAETSYGNKGKNQ